MQGSNLHPYLVGWWLLSTNKSHICAWTESPYIQRGDLGPDPILLTWMWPELKCLFFLPCCFILFSLFSFSVTAGLGLATVSTCLGLENLIQAETQSFTAVSTCWSKPPSSNCQLIYLVSMVTDVAAVTPHGINLRDICWAIPCAEIQHRVVVTRMYVMNWELELVTAASRN